MSTAHYRDNSNAQHSAAASACNSSIGASRKERGESPAPLLYHR
nr:MAG TPA: hypothetical protein [Caudoviricetes sp.]